MEAQAEVVSPKSGPVLVRTSKDEAIEATTEAFDDEVADVRAQAEGMVGFAVVAICADGSVVTASFVSNRCPVHRLLVPELARNALLEDLFQAKEQ